MRIQYPAKVVSTSLQSHIVAHVTCLALSLLQAFPGAGNIVRSAGTGAGFVFKTSAIPLAIFTLNQCSAVAPHIHPNSAETLFVLEGRSWVVVLVGT